MSRRNRSAASTRTTNNGPRPSPPTSATRTRATTGGPRYGRPRWGCRYTRTRFRNKNKRSQTSGGGRGRYRSHRATGPYGPTGRRGSRNNGRGKSTDCYRRYKGGCGSGPLRGSATQTHYAPAPRKYKNTSATATRRRSTTASAARGWSVGRRRWRGESGNDARYQPPTSRRRGGRASPHESRARIFDGHNGSSESAIGTTTARPGQARTRSTDVGGARSLILPPYRAH